jgi:hypothetical protein
MHFSDAVIIVEYGDISDCTPAVVGSDAYRVSFDSNVFEHGGKQHSFICAVAITVFQSFFGRVSDLIAGEVALDRNISDFFLAELVESGDFFVQITGAGD